MNEKMTYNQINCLTFLLKTWKKKSWDRKCGLVKDIFILFAVKKKKKKL